ncbi:MAG: hypothetical protein J0L78_00305 [Planctomycetes bacterium]|nr:hypothetical protein [Planctomycetota bacterium]
MSGSTPTNMNMLRLISFAMSAGMLIFAVVTIFLTLENKSPATTPGPPSRTPQADLATMLLGLTGVVGFGGLVVSAVLGRASLGAARAAWRGTGDVASKEQAIWSRYSTLVISRTAIAESFGLLGVITLFLGGPPLGWWGLAAPVIAIGAILMGLPSQAGYDRFLTRATSDF